MASLNIDILQPTAGQQATTILLAPSVIGWMLALFGCGYVTSVANAYIGGDLFRRDPVRLKIAAVIIPLLVLISAAINAAEIFHYLTFQGRAFEDIAGIVAADCIVLLPQALVAALVQVSLAHRVVTVRAAPLLEGTTYVFSHLSHTAHKVWDPQVGVRGGRQLSDPDRARLGNHKRRCIL